ncbi:MAG: hypothetical protein J7M39_07470, partial [Anaerolineae bacterium]|nr:hypothetical protein [Anaerolineae bacterium]
IEVLAYDTVKTADAERPPVVDHDLGFCGVDSGLAYTGKVLCGPEPTTVIELRHCVTGECEGCPPGSCDTFLHTQDVNAWIKVMLTTPLDQSSEAYREAEVRAVAARVREILAQKRGDVNSEELQLNLSCGPPAPAVGDEIVCTVNVLNPEPDEEIEISWYLDYAHEVTGAQQVWSWIPDGPGPHDVAVLVAGEMRTGEAGLVVEVAETEISRFAIASLSCEGENSDEPLSCVAVLQRDSGFDGSLRCAWHVDGTAAAGDETTANTCSFELARPAPGTHTVRLEVQDVASSQTRTEITSVVISEGALPAPAPAPYSTTNEISGGAQAGAAIGTTTVVGAWLWLEWLRARRNAVSDAELEADRRRWFEQQMARNDAERAVRQVREAQVDAEQQALHSQWNQLWNGLLDISRQSEGMDHVLEWVERHRDDVYHDGQWDPAAMAWLQEGARRLGARQTDRAFYNAKKAFADTVTPAMETVFTMSRSMVVRVGTDILSAGTAEILWTPMSALDTMWTQVSVHHTSAEKAASVAYRETAKSLVAQVLWNRVAVGAGQAFSPELTAAKRAVVDSARRRLAASSAGTQRVVRVLTRVLTTPIDSSLRRAVDGWRRRAPADLPSIGHVPGGPDTYLDASTPYVRRWQRLRELGLADDVEGVLRRSGGRPDIQPVSSLQPGQGVTLTPDEEVGRRLLNHPNYRQAVADGAVPRPVHELVNATRDKLGRQAIHRALEDVRLRRPDLAEKIARVEITGTGARPRSAPATSGWTDLDITIRGVDDSVASRLAEGEVAEAFSTRLREAGVDPGRADAHAFPGLRPRTSAAAEGAYQSSGMVEWQATDVTYRGRVAIQGEHGTTYFDAHPDVRPLGGQEPLVNPTGRMRRLVSIDPAAAAADARRLVEEHVAQMPDHLGRPPTRLDILRSEGKHARRAWWVRHAGSGTEAPPGLRVLDRMKTDRTYVPGHEDLDAAWRAFTDTLSTNENLGEIR